MRRANEANREKFVKAAVSELEEHGASDFSIRRVARRCGLSCAAPYKHFESREALMLEVIRYINHKWDAIRNDTVQAYEKASPKEKIVAVCMAYLTFLCTYPEYQTILFMNDRLLTVEVVEEKGRLSTAIDGLISEYCQSVAMPDEVRARKQYVICSLLCGTAMMVNSGAIPFESQTIARMKTHIEREFELA